MRFARARPLPAPVRKLLRERRSANLPSSRYALASYYVARNTVAVLVKNLPGPLLRRHLPAIAAYQVSLAIGTLPHLREPAARARLRGLLAAPRLIPALLPKRRRIQSARRVSLVGIELLLSR